MLAGGAVLAILRAKKPTWAAPSLYGLAGVALTAIIVYTATGHAILSKQRPQTTPENVETNIRAWADNFRLAVQKQSDPTAHFLLLITLPNGIPVYVGRYNATDRYITFQAKLDVSPEHQAILAKLPKDRAMQVQTEVSLELARSKVGFTIRGSGSQIRVVVISKTAPITSSLTEDVFAALLNEMDSDVTLARAAIVLAIGRR